MSNDKLKTLSRIGDILQELHSGVAQIESMQADGFTFAEAVMIGRLTQSLHTKLYRESNYIENLKDEKNINFMPSELPRTSYK